MRGASTAEDSATQRMQKLLLRRKVFSIISNDEIIVILTLTDPHNSYSDPNRPSRRQLIEVMQFGQCACAEGCACAKVFCRENFIKNITSGAEFSAAEELSFKNTWFLSIKLYGSKMTHSDVLGGRKQPTF